MPDSPNRMVIKRQRRLPLNGSPSGRVTVLRSDGAMPAEAHGMLKDMSTGGVRIHLDDCIPRDVEAKLRIVFDDAMGDHDGELELDICVCWSRPAGDGQWTIGCQCETALSDDVFAMFAENGQIERRRAARRPTQLVAMARWEMSLSERPIEITNASRTGFWFRSAKMGSMGDRVLVRLTTIHGEEVTVAAELRWNARTDTGYVGGCSLVNENDHRHLMPFAAEDKSDIGRRRQTSSPEKRVPRSPNLVFAATVFLMFMGPSVLVLPLLQAQRKARAIPIAQTEPNEATAEIRLARVDRDTPLSGASASGVVPGELAEPDTTLTQVYPVDIAPIDIAPIDNAPIDNAPIDDAPMNDAPSEHMPIMEPPIGVSLTEETALDQPRDEPPQNAPVDTVPIDEVPIDEVPINETPVNEVRADDAAVEDTPVTRTAEEPNLRHLGSEETFRSAVPPEVRIPDVEFVILQEAVDDSPTVAPNTLPQNTLPHGASPPATVTAALNAPVLVPPIAVPPIAAEAGVAEPDVVEADVVEPDFSGPDIAEPDIAEPDIVEPDVAELFATEPIVDETVISAPMISAPVISAPVIVPQVITPAARRRAAAEFSRGRDALASGDHGGALTSFALATASNPDVALYQYHWALALYLNDQPQAAIARVAEASRLEHKHGVANWGQVMQRIQGRPRMWLERERRQALAGD